MENAVLEIYLMLCAVWDIKKRKIPLWFLIAGIILGSLFFGVMCHSGICRWVEIGMSALPGIIMIGYSLLSKGKIGGADGMIVLTAGMIKPGMYGLWLTAIACLLAFLFAAAGIALKRLSWQSRIPYAPFLVCAASVLWITESF